MYMDSKNSKYKVLSSIKILNCIFTVFNHEEHMVNEHPQN